MSAMSELDTLTRYHVEQGDPCGDCNAPRWEVCKPDGERLLVCPTLEAAAEWADKLNERFGL